MDLLEDLVNVDCIRFSTFLRSLFLVSRGDRRHRLLALGVGLRHGFRSLRSHCESGWVRLGVSLSKKIYRANAISMIVLHVGSSIHLTGSVTSAALDKVRMADV